jgi:PKD repeat protein
MNYLSRIILFIALGSIFQVGITGQDSHLTDIRTIINSTDKKLYINYTLLQLDDGTKYFQVEVKLIYEGHDIIPSTDNLMGDFGSKVTPGNKIIQWSYGNEFNGDINKVRAEVKLRSGKRPQAIINVKEIANQGNAPFRVLFGNHSTEADIYKWDFGDTSSESDNYSEQTFPTHVYKSAGTYTVTLLAINSSTFEESKFYKTIEIKSPDNIVADFTYPQENYKVPIVVGFTNISLNANKFHWDFGDPNSQNKNFSSEPNPKHKFIVGDTFKVRLIASNSYTEQIDTTVKELIIAKKDVTEARFSFSKSTEKAPTVVSFKNNSLLADTYKWNFGDSISGDMNISKEKSPVHLYNLSGNYVVRLKAHPKGIRGLLKKPAVYSDTIIIGGSATAPKAGFIIENSDVIYAPTSVIFKNTSIHASKYSWNFGDPDSKRLNTSAEINPTHTYLKPGSYKVILIAESESNQEISVYKRTIDVLNASVVRGAGTN